MPSGREEVLANVRAIICKCNPLKGHSGSLENAYSHLGVSWGADGYFEAGWASTQTAWAYMAGHMPNRLSRKCCSGGPAIPGRWLVVFDLAIISMQKLFWEVSGKSHGPHAGACGQGNDFTWYAISLFGSTPRTRQLRRTQGSRALMSKALVSAGRNKITR